MIANTVGTPQSYYIYQSYCTSYVYFTMIVVINNCYYSVYYRGFGVLIGARTVMEILEDWESLDIEIILTHTLPDKIQCFMKFTAVDVLQDHIKSLICLEAL